MAVREPPRSWLVLVYRVPSEPSRHRVAVWREMKRMGALYLQNCVCILPNYSGLRVRLKEMAGRIEGMSGSSYTFEIRKIAEPQLGEVIGMFRQQSDREYDEIIEECTTKFQREIEFERFRQNYTYEEAEEIYSDLEKIRAWLARVIERDWFGSERRAEAERQLAISEEAYDAFERDCYAASGGDGGPGDVGPSRPLPRAAGANGGAERRKSGAAGRGARRRGRPSA